MAINAPSSYQVRTEAAQEFSGLAMSMLDFSDGIKGILGVGGGSDFTRRNSGRPGGIEWNYDVNSRAA